MTASCHSIGEEKIKGKAIELQKLRKHKQLSCFQDHAALHYPNSRVKKKIEIRGVLILSFLFTLLEMKEQAAANSTEEKTILELQKRN